MSLKNASFHKYWKQRNNGPILYVGRRFVTKQTLYCVKDICRVTVDDAMQTSTRSAVFGTVGQLNDDKVTLSRIYS